MKFPDKLRTFEKFVLVNFDMKFWLKLLHEKSENVQSTKTHKGNYHVHDFVIKFNFLSNSPHDKAF
jgi:hypothetical protein